MDRPDLESGLHSDSRVKYHANDHLTFSRQATVVRDIYPAIKRLDISYDANDSFRNLFRWRGTALRMLATRPTFWIVSCWYIGLRLLDANGVGSFQSWTSETSITVSAGLIAFMLVFFCQQAYQRYLEVYQATQRCGGLLTDILLMLRCKLWNRDHIGHKIRLFRYLSAAHHLVYYGMPTFMEHKVLKTEWIDHLINQRMLLEEEAHIIYKLRRSTRGPYLEVLFWFLNHVYGLRDSGIFNVHDTRDLELSVRKLREAMTFLHVRSEDPIPLAYYHILHFVIFQYLLLLGWHATFSQDSWHAYWYFIYVVSVQGLLQVANALADPFGDDESDIPVQSYLADLYYLQYQTLLLPAPTSAMIPKGWESLSPQNMATPGMESGAPRTDLRDLQIDDFLADHENPYDSGRVDEIAEEKKKHVVKFPSHVAVHAPDPSKTLGIIKSARERDLARSLSLPDSRVSSGSAVGTTTGSKRANNLTVKSPNSSLSQDLRASQNASFPCLNVPTPTDATETRDMSTTRSDPTDVRAETNPEAEAEADTNANNDNNERDTSGEFAPPPIRGRRPSLRPGYYNSAAIPPSSSSSFDAVAKRLQQQLELPDTFVPVPQRALLKSLDDGSPSNKRHSQ